VGQREARRSDVVQPRDEPTQGAPEVPDDLWVQVDSVWIHSLDNARRESRLAPVLILPGFGESAEEFAWLVRTLSDRRAIAVSLRGRGRSDAPVSGYTWEDHIADIEAVVHASGVGPPVLMGFSRGSSYALGYALAHPDAVRGLVIGDYEARHIGLPPEFIEMQRTAVLRGVPMSERMPDHAVAGVQRESIEIPLWDRLVELSCPVLVIRGGWRGTLVSDEGEERYRRALPGVQVAMLPRAGHDLWSRDTAAFVEVIAPFLDAVDGAE
jgi:pimeloyl-ACP methyl ester carboxylesterase